MIRFGGSSEGMFLLLMLLLMPVFLLVPQHSEFEWWSQKSTTISEIPQLCDRVPGPSLHSAPQSLHPTRHWRLIFFSDSFSFPSCPWKFPNTIFALQNVFSEVRDHRNSWAAACWEDFSAQLWCRHWSHLSQKLETGMRISALHICMQFLPKKFLPIPVTLRKSSHLTMLCLSIDWLFCNLCISAPKCYTRGSTGPGSNNFTKSFSWQIM